MGGIATTRHGETMVQTRVPGLIDTRGGDHALENEEYRMDKSLLDFRPHNTSYHLKYLVLLVYKTNELAQWTRRRPQRVVILEE